MVEGGPATRSIENLYGPTELTIACTLYRWDPSDRREDCELGLVPIGDPYPGMEVLRRRRRSRAGGRRARPASC